MYTAERDARRARLRAAVVLYDDAQRAAKEAYDYATPFALKIAELNAVHIDARNAKWEADHQVYKAMFNARWESVETANAKVDSARETADYIELCNFAWESQHANDLRTNIANYMTG